MYESPRLRRECLVCSQERGGLAASAVSARGGLPRGWRLVRRARAGRSRRRGVELLFSDESRQTFVG